jgi:hypothetical protein
LGFDPMVLATLPSDLFGAASFESSKVFASSPRLFWVAIF